VGEACAECLFLLLRHLNETLIEERDPVRVHVELRKSALGHHIIVPEVLRDRKHHKVIELADLRVHLLAFLCGEGFGFSMERDGNNEGGGLLLDLNRILLGHCLAIPQENE
jgi:hypothetical protein